MCIRDSQKAVWDRLLRIPYGETTTYGEIAAALAAQQGRAHPVSYTHLGALRDLHIFSALSQRMVHTFSTVRGVCTALVVITMFGSMLLTNDTALLTFLPLGWFVLSSTGQEKHTALLFILQNCAANLCGMITPFGNPQNLYLFSYYSLSTKTFFSAMLPPFILSTVLILLCCLVFPKERCV